MASLTLKLTDLPARFHVSLAGLKDASADEEDSAAEEGTERKPKKTTLREYESIRDFKVRLVKKRLIKVDKFFRGVYLNDWPTTAMGMQTLLTQNLVYIIIRRVLVCYDLCDEMPDVT